MKLVEEVRLEILEAMTKADLDHTTANKIMVWKLARDFFTNSLLNCVEKATLICELDIDILNFQNGHKL